MSLEAKKCPRCLVLKAASEFYHYKSPTGNPCLSSYCKTCMSAAQREWRLNNPKWAGEYQKKYRRKNPDLVRGWDRNKYYKNPEKSSFMNGRRRARRVLKDPTWPDRKYINRPGARKYDRKLIKPLDISLGGKLK